MTLLLVICMCMDLKHSHSLANDPFEKTSPIKSNITDKTLYFPHFAKNRDLFATFIAFANTTSSPQEVTVYAMAETGDLLATETLSLEPFSTFSEQVDVIFHGLTPFPAWAKAVTQPGVNGLSLFYSRIGTMGPLTAIPALSSGWTHQIMVFPPNTDYWTGVSLLNLSENEPMEVSYTLEELGGNSKQVVTRRIAASQKDLFLVDSLVQNNKMDQGFRLDIVSSSPCLGFGLCGDVDFQQLVALPLHPATYEKGLETTSTQTPYVVATPIDCDFQDQALYFAAAKNAILTTFDQAQRGLLQALQLTQPVFTAVVVTPDRVTPAFTDNMDVLSRNIDSDPFVDTSWGILTARDETQFKHYLQRLIDYAPPANLSIYGISPTYKYTDLNDDYQIPVERNCLSHCGGSLCVCDDEHRATFERIQAGLDYANVFVLGAHGSPGSIELDGEDRLLGTPDGLMAYGYDSEWELKHNIVVTIAESCLNV